MGVTSPCTVFLLGATLALHAEPTAAPQAGRLKEVVRQAFRETHQGFSADEILVDDRLNKAFVAACRRELPHVEEATLNRTLLNLRKAGELKVPATRRRVVRHEEYLHAAEIAARLMYDRYGTTMDRVLCDPELRREFDQQAQAVAPDVSAYRLRKAALGLRKARRLRPELAVRVADWGKQVLTLPAAKIAKSPKLVPARPGVYIFRDRSGYLYIGQSSDLQRRLAKHLDRSDRSSLAAYFASRAVEDITVELHVFDPQSKARLAEMRRAYESELIRSRKPRFNIAP